MILNDCEWKWGEIYPELSHEKKNACVFQDVKNVLGLYVLLKKTILHIKKVANPHNCS